MPTRSSGFLGSARVSRLVRQPSPDPAGVSDRWSLFHSDQLDRRLLPRSQATAPRARAFFGAHSRQTETFGIVTRNSLQTNDLGRKFARRQKLSSHVSPSAARPLRCDGVLGGPTTGVRTAMSEASGEWTEDMGRHRWRRSRITVSERPTLDGRGGRKIAAIRYRRDNQQNTNNADRRPGRRERPETF
jgi:hypothetical protein